MAAGYREYAVDPRLARHVACYWSHDLATGLRGSHLVFPDGCIDLLFESGTQTLNVVGAMTRTLWVEHLGPTQFVGIRFKAGGAVPFLRDRADLFTDDVVGADEVFGPAGSELKERLLAGFSDAERVRLLELFLLIRLQANAPSVDTRIAWATAKLIDIPESKIEDLAHELGMSRQYVRRIFLQHTGLSPKAFARAARLRRLVEVLRDGARLGDAALESGYFDQAHMNHEFKDLVGITPVEYRNRD